MMASFLKRYYARCQILIGSLCISNLKIGYIKLIVKHLLYYRAEREMYKNFVTKGFLYDSKFETLKPSLNY